MSIIHVNMYIFVTGLLLLTQVNCLFIFRYVIIDNFPRRDCAMFSLLTKPEIVDTRS